MTALAQDLQGQGSRLADAFDIEAVKAHLCEAGGGYEILFDSPWLQIGVYALFAPEPDHQRTNSNNALYAVVEGRGLLDVEGEQLELREGHAAFVPAGANYRFSAYEQLSVVVISQKGRDDVQRSVVTSLKRKLEPQATAADRERAQDEDEKHRATKARTRPVTSSLADPRGCGTFVAIIARERNQPALPRRAARAHAVAGGNR